MLLMITISGRPNLCMIRSRPLCYFDGAPVSLNTNCDTPALSAMITAMMAAISNRRVN